LLYSSYLPADLDWGIVNLPQSRSASKPKKTFNTNPMAIPLLAYAPSSQNPRVLSFEIAGDEQPRIYSTQDLRSASEMDDLIRVAYLQVFHEQQMLQVNRQSILESQLRAHQITVKDFVRGLATSYAFRTYNYDCNTNYRFVQLCIQRLWGREVYSDRETQAWSIVLATQGLNGFIDALLSEDEYNDAFGDDTVPYQRRRILPQRSQGDLPNARTPRYSDYHLVHLKDLGNFLHSPTGLSNLRWEWQRRGIPQPAVQAGKVVTLGGALLLGGLVGAIALAALGLINL
jgi:phycobilisome rod-core linker protein